MSDAPRDIRLFVAAYETRSFTAAAAREAATQSGVSQHVRKLEDRFGTRLFARDGGRVTPTPAGDTFYLRCLDILHAYQAAAHTLRDASRGLEGEVRVGLMPTVTRCALAPALARFLALHPNVTIRVVEGYSAALTGQVGGGELDFAVVPAFADTAGLRSRHLVSTPELLVAAHTSARRHGAPVRLAELGPLKVVVPERQNTRRQALDTFFASGGARIERVLELDSMLATLDLVATSDWVTILPGLLMARDVREAAARFTINPLRHPLLSLDLVVIEAVRRPVSRPAQAFQDVLEAAVAEIGEELWPSGDWRQS